MVWTTIHGGIAMSHLDTMVGSDASQALPMVRKIGMTDLRDALAKGVEDFSAIPTHAILESRDDGDVGINHRRPLVDWLAAAVHRTCGCDAGARTFDLAPVSQGGGARRKSWTRRADRAETPASALRG